MTSFLATLPDAALTALGITAAAIIAALGALIGHLLAARGATRSDRRELLALAQQAAGEVIDDLRTEVQRLGQRVERLEHERSRYRHWAGLLWAHIHDPDIPRLPAPEWPEDLPR